MKQLLSLALCMHFFSSLSQAQIIGSDTVCAGYIYTYTITVPGAASYVWIVPTGWYELNGQGTSQISVTCNVNAGSVCVESFDSNSISLGSQCLITYFGNDGSGNYHLEPSGNNQVCDIVTSVNIVPTLIYDGPGGGGCLPGCGNGTLHPNIVWGIYGGLFFEGLVGTSMTLGIYSTYTVAYVDVTNGYNFPQARVISGCGGSVSGSFTFNPVYNFSTTWVSSNFICVGDTFWLYGDGSSFCTSGAEVWSQFSNLTPLTDPDNTFEIQVIATGSPIIYTYASCMMLTEGMFAGNTCWFADYYSLIISNCDVDAGFNVISTTICEDNCLSFTNTTTHATSYEWSFPGATPSNSIDTNPGNICYPDTGLYDVTLIASNPDYADTLYLPGYVHVVSAPQAVFILDTNFTCSNDCILLSNLSLNTSTYQWSFPGANPSSSIDSFPGPVCYPNAGNYDITLVSLNAGCSDTLTIPAAVNVEQSPQADFTVSMSGLCPGSCIDFYNQSINGSIYSWNFQGANPDSSADENPLMICYADSGHFDVTLIVTNGSCSDTLSMSQYISVYPSPPPVSIQQSGDTLYVSQAFASYQWYQDGNLISGATQSFYVCTSNGDYNIIATDVNGCEAEAAIYNVLTRTSSELRHRNDFLVYPNPTRDILRIELPEYFVFIPNISLRILDLQNRVLYSIKFINPTIDVNQLGEGMYFIEIIGEHTVYRTSFLKWQ